jgi:hypothetical protein
MHQAKTRIMIVSHYMVIANAVRRSLDCASPEKSQQVADTCKVALGRLAKRAEQYALIVVDDSMRECNSFVATVRKQFSAEEMPIIAYGYAAWQDDASVLIVRPNIAPVAGAGSLQEVVRQCLTKRRRS